MGGGPNTVFDIPVNTDKPVFVFSGGGVGGGTLRLQAVGGNRYYRYYRK